MYRSNPLWRTFIFIALSSLVTAAIVGFAQWNNIKNEAKKELIYANNIMTSSIQSVLNKNESLLKILGERLLELGALQHSSATSLTLINSLLEDNKELAGIGLADLSGQLVLTSFNIDRNKLPNLLETPETAKTFKQALNKQSMVVGRTYYMKALQQWVIPLRYRITNPKGQVTAVMTTGLKLDSSQSIWSSKGLPAHMKALIVRKDLYRQNTSDAETRNLATTYTKPIPQNKYHYFERLLLDQTGMNLSELRTSGKTTTLFANYREDNIPVLASVNYDAIYEHYTLIVTPVNYLYRKLFTTISLILALLVFFNAALYWIFRTNIRLQNASEHNLEFQAAHDPLTELPNRRHLLDKFNAWKDSHNGKLSVLFIDLANFKSINDLHGHTIGDEILQKVASRIRHSFKNSLCVRQGGDEFIILSPEINTKVIFSLCDDFLNKLKQPIVIGKLDFSISANIGIALAPIHGHDVDTLLRKADMAMYEAKRKQLAACAFSEWLEEQQKRVAAIESKLTHALERNEFHLVYQPQVDAMNHSLIGIETLIRWDNPTLGMVSPVEFIPIAESTGLIIDIGLYVLDTALDDLSTIIEDYKITNHIRLSVNVSVRQLLNNDFLDKLSIIVSTPKYVDIDLVIEVTESLFIQDIEHARLTLTEIQKLGIAVSLDDFGTGYSSLSVLNNLPINELKIDKSFVRDIMNNDQNKKLIRSIINLGKTLDIPILAEGVEDEDQASFLTENGCNLFQGYYFSKPLSKEKLISYITD